MRQRAKRTYLDAERKRGLFSYDDVDLRTKAGQRMRELYRDLCADKGGEVAVSVAERQLARRAAFLNALCEDDEVRWLTGLPFDRGDYLPTVNAEGRVYERLGVERRAL